MQQWTRHEQTWTKWQIVKLHFYKPNGYSLQSANNSFSETDNLEQCTNQVSNRNVNTLNGPFENSVVAFYLFNWLLVQTQLILCMKKTNSSEKERRKVFKF